MSKKNEAPSNASQPARNSTEQANVHGPHGPTTFSVQDYLSLGYIYLLLLGIITQVIFYKLIGINILAYHSLFDVLLSPIVFMTKSWKIMLVILGAVIVAKILAIRFERKKKERIANGEVDDGPVPSGQQFVEDNFFLSFTSLVIFFMFIGGGIGAGSREAQRLENGDFEPTHVLEFVDSERRSVRIIGQNSAFVFYGIPGTSGVRIAPIEGNIKLIRGFSEKMDANLNLPPAAIPPDEGAQAASDTED